MYAAIIVPIVLITRPITPVAISAGVSRSVGPALPSSVDSIILSLVITAIVHASGNGVSVEASKVR